MARKPKPTFMKPLNVSAALAAVVGEGPMPRTEVVKKLWAYIKKYGLQEKVNKRMINADGALKEVFDGKGKVSIFEMTKLVFGHLDCELEVDVYSNEDYPQSVTVQHVLENDFAAYKEEPLDSKAEISDAEVSLLMHEITCEYLSAAAAAHNSGNLEVAEELFANALLFSGYRDSEIISSITNIKLEPSGLIQVSTELTDAILFSKLGMLNFIKHVLSKKKGDFPPESQADISVISPLDFKRNTRQLLDAVHNGSRYIISRKKKSVACLVPYSRTDEEGHDFQVISVTELIRSRGSLIDQARSGIQFIIERRGEKTAILGPPPKRHKRELSDEELVKLALIKEFSVEEVQKAVAILHGAVDQ